MLRQQQKTKAEQKMNEAINEMTAVEVSAVAENIKLLLHNHHLTKRAFAQEIGYSETAVTEWMKGERLPSTAAMRSIAGLFGCSVADLKIPQPTRKVEATLDGLTIEQWRNRALTAENKIKFEIHTKETTDSMFK